MNYIIFLVAVVFAITAHYLTYRYWERKYKNKCIEASLKKYEQYLKQKYTYFCYNDDDFIFAVQPKNGITIKDGIIKYNTVSISIDSIKEIKYDYKIHKLSINTTDDIKVNIYLKNGEVVNFIVKDAIEIWYKLSFVLVVSMIINNYDQNKFDLLNHLNDLKGTI